VNYYVWYDENAQKSTIEKIHEAIASYTNRFAIVPNLVLVHMDEKAELAGVEIRGERNIQRNNFWIGMEQAEKREESHE
jgi:hypothetical protein